MSLRAFHIVFIVASALLSLGFGVWALTGDGASSTVASVVAFMVGAALVVYGVRFLKKVAHTGHIAGGKS